MLTRRTAMFSAAIAAMMLAAPAVAEDLKLPRQKVDLVAPPFVRTNRRPSRARRSWSSSSWSRKRRW